MCRIIGTFFTLAYQKTHTITSELGWTYNQIQAPTDHTIKGKIYFVVCNQNRSSKYRKVGSIPQAFYLYRLPAKG